MASNANLVISITAKDGTSSTFRKVKMNLGDLEKSSGDLGESVGGLGDIFGSTLGKIGAGIGAAFAVEKIASTAFELGKVGAQAQRTQASFDQMAAGVGSSGEAMLSAMRTATAGTVSNSELMLAANRAIMLGVADNADEMSRLMAAAIERGRALGVSASQAVSDVITGIGRMSPQILDNLGIVGATKAIDDYAVSLGKTSEQLTDVERKQALVNVVLAGASGPAVIDDAAAAFERMDASIQNAKEALGQLFAPAVAAIAEQIADATRQATDALIDQADAAARTVDVRSKVAGTLADARLAGVDDPSTQYRILNDALAETERRAAAATESMQALAQDAQRQIANIASTPGMDPTQAAAEFQAMLSDAIRMSQYLTAQANQIQAAIDGIGVAGSDAGQALAVVVDGETVRLNTMVQAAEQAQQAVEYLAQATTTIQNSAQSGLAQIAQIISEYAGAEGAIGWLRTANVELEQQVAQWVEAGYSIQEITGVLLPQYIDKQRQIFEGARDAAAATAAIGKGAVQADATAAGALARLARRVDTITARAGVAAGALARLGAAADGIAGKQNAMLAAVRGEGIGEGTRRADELTDATGRLASGLQSVIDVGTGGGGGGGISSVGDQFDDLRSKVQGIIDQSTTLDVGLNPADFLPREDAINENARRLAAIMRDGIGNQEWLDEFKAEVPALWEELSTSGDPQAAAARMLQEFQAGLRPELLDKQMIKDRVKAMILGDQSSADLANEIAQELSSELGVSLAQAQQAVGGFMGGGLGATVPLEQAGPDGAQPAQNFVNKWTATVTAMLSDFDQTGRSAGNAFGTGFMAVQGVYIDQWAAALVSIVTAGVLANMAAQASRTGAR